MKPIKSAKIAPPIGPYSAGISCEDLVFFSGQIALDAEGNFHGDSLETELGQVFKNIKNLLAAAKIKKENVVKTTVFLTNLSDFGAVNQKYAEFFAPHAPARSCVQVAGLPMGAKVEIEVLAARNT